MAKEEVCAPRFIGHFNQHAKAAIFDFEAGVSQLGEQVNDFVGMVAVLSAPFSEHFGEDERAITLDGLNSALECKDLGTLNVALD